MKCPECSREIHKDDIVWTGEDQTETVPYGDTFIDVGGIVHVPYCPFCDEELEYESC